MQTPDPMRSPEQPASFSWLPIYYVLSFASVFLISLWAEVIRREEQTVCSCVGVHSPATTEAENALPRSVSQTHWNRDVKRPF